MQKEMCSSAAAQRGVLLPAYAHHALTQTRDQLRLLSRLVEPRGSASDVEIRLSTDALAELFDRVAGELDEVLDAVIDSPA